MSERVNVRYDITLRVEHPRVSGSEIAQRLQVLGTPIEVRDVGSVNIDHSEQVSAHPEWLSSVLFEIGSGLTDLEPVLGELLDKLLGHREYIRELDLLGEVFLNIVGHFRTFDYIFMEPGWYRRICGMGIAVVFHVHPAFDEAAPGELNEQKVRPLPLSP